MNPSSAVPKAVVLLSGGLDSAVTLALAREAGLDCFALTIRYGQRHAREVECARRVAAALGAAQHRILDLDLKAFGGSSLLGEGEVPGQGVGDGIPSTYVPARNTIFLSLALAWAEVLDAVAIYLGINAVDYSGYPDCRPEFLEAFRGLARLATRSGVEGRGVELRAPLLLLTKGQIVSEGLRAGVDFALTSSCYDPLPDGRPCGACDSCRLRRKGFEEAGAADPLADPLAEPPRAVGER
jgi:7-cyano-7-deazaguanine synthase